MTIADSRDRLNRELAMLGAKYLTISSNLRLRDDGQPAGQQPNPSDPGVCVYFRLSGQPRCLPCDRWDRAADNLAAIAKYVEALRGQIRWGVGSADVAFAGFKALPNGGAEAIVTPERMTVEVATRVVASAAGVAVTDVLDRSRWPDVYRDGAKHRHPDSGRQSHEAWLEYQRAADILKRHHGIA